MRFTLLVFAAGCAVGPGYHPSPVVTPATQVGVATYSDTAKRFYDSLAAARAADSLSATGVAPLTPRSLRADSIADLAWLDILHDSTLNALVQVALRQNRDLATAKARIDEYRADVGLARAPLRRRSRRARWRRVRRPWTWHASGFPAA
jgi:outer membrane protein TolC